MWIPRHKEVRIPDPHAECDKRGGWDVNGEWVLEDYVDEADQQQLRTRTKYWRSTFPEE